MDEIMRKHNTIKMMKWWWPLSVAASLQEFIEKNGWSDYDFMEVSRGVSPVILPVEDERNWFDDPVPNFSPLFETENITLDRVAFRNPYIGIAWVHIGAGKRVKKLIWSAPGQDFSLSPMIP